MVGWGGLLVGLGIGFFVFVGFGSSVGGGGSSVGGGGSSVGGGFSVGGFVGSGSISPSPESGVLVIPGAGVDEAPGVSVAEAKGVGVSLGTNVNVDEGLGVTVGDGVSVWDPNVLSSSVGDMGTGVFNDLPPA